MRIIPVLRTERGGRYASSEGFALLNRSVIHTLRFPVLADYEPLTWHKFPYFLSPFLNRYMK